MIILDKNLNLQVAEDYRALRTNIKYYSFDNKIKKILVTSSEPREGKSITVGNLALVFAEDKKKTLIIDCDLRKPSIYKKFNISNTIGLSDVIMNMGNLENAIIKYSEYLDILPSGKIPPNPSEMIGSMTMDMLLEKLSEIYDLIIIDSPPILAVTDAQIISTKVDGTLIVVRSGKTKIETLNLAKSTLDKVNAKILGAILNGRDKSRESYYDYYGE